MLMLKSTWYAEKNALMDRIESLERRQGTVEDKLRGIYISEPAEWFLPSRFRTQTFLPFGDAIQRIAQHLGLRFRNEQGTQPCVVLEKDPGPLKFRVAAFDKSKKGKAK